MMERPGIERRRTGLALAALVAVAPATLFFVAAVGRLLQPTAHQPARALERIFEAFAALSPALLAGLLVAGPLLALAIGGYLVVAEWRADVDLRADATAFVSAAFHLLRHPAFVVGFAVVALAALMTAALLVHAITG